MNPLLQPFNTAPFSKVKATDFKPAIKKAIEITRTEIDTITSNSEAPTFENTTVALDFTGEKLNRITSIFSILMLLKPMKTFNKLLKKFLLG